MDYLDDTEETSFQSNLISDENGGNEGEALNQPESLNVDLYNDDTFGASSSIMSMEKDFDFARQTDFFFKQLSLKDPSVNDSSPSSHYANSSPSTASSSFSAFMERSLLDPSRLKANSSKTKSELSHGDDTAGAQLLALLKKPSTASPSEPSTSLPPGLSLNVAPPPGLNPFPPSQMMQESTQSKDKFIGFMTDHDVIRIHNILLAQLVTENPYLDDFYYQSYTKNANKRKSQSSSGFKDTLYLPLPHVPDRYLNKPPKPTDLVVEGALGKVALNSLRKPKQSIVVAAPTTTSTLTRLPSLGKNKSKLEVLKSVDVIFSSLIQIDDIFSEHSPNDFRTLHEKEKLAVPFKKIIMSELGIEYPDIGIKRHPLIDIVNVGVRGKRLISRVIEVIANEYKQNLFTHLIKNMEYFDVITHPSKEKEELFVQCVLSPMVSFVSDVNFDVIQMWAQNLVKKKLFLDIALQKMGHVILCILMSRAEMLKSNYDDSSPLILKWKEIIQQIFSSLTKSFGHLFKPRGLTEEDTFHPEEEYYVWQFLTLLAMNLDSESCHEMVAELRSEILFHANHRQPKAVSNVNLLLHVIGLDASQLKM